MLIGIWGQPRSGKGILNTLLCYQSFYKSKRLNRVNKFYANYKLDIAERINPLQLLDFELKNATVSLSECHTFMDSRNSMSVANKLFSYFFTQGGKRNVDVICDAQLTRSVDVRLREIMEINFDARKEVDNKQFRYFKSRGNSMTSFTVSFKVASLFWNKYDSREIIYPLGMDSNSVDFNKIKEIFDESPNKKSFSKLVRSVYPFVTLDSADSCYYYLKNDREDNAKKCLGIRK